MVIMIPCLIQQACSPDILSEKLHQALVSMRERMMVLVDDTVGGQNPTPPLRAPILGHCSTFGALVDARFPPSI